MNHFSANIAKTNTYQAAANSLAKTPGRDAYLVDKRKAVTAQLKESKSAQTVHAPQTSQPVSGSVVQLVGDAKFGIRKVVTGGMTGGLGMRKLIEVRAAYKNAATFAEWKAGNEFKNSDQDAAAQAEYTQKLEEAEMKPAGLYQKLKEKDSRFEIQGNNIFYNRIKIAVVHQGNDSDKESQPETPGTGSTSTRPPLNNNANEYVYPQGQKPRRFASRGVTPPVRGAIKEGRPLSLLNSRLGTAGSTTGNNFNNRTGQNRRARPVPPSFAKQAARANIPLTHNREIATGFEEPQSRVEYEKEFCELYTKPYKMGYKQAFKDRRMPYDQEPPNPVSFPFNQMHFTGEQAQQDVDKRSAWQRGYRTAEQKIRSDKAAQRRMATAGG